MSRADFRHSNQTELTKGSPLLQRPVWEAWRNLPDLRPDPDSPSLSRAITDSSDLVPLTTGVAGATAAT